MNAQTLEKFQELDALVAEARKSFPWLTAITDDSLYDLVYWTWARGWYDGHAERRKVTP